MARKVLERVSIDEVTGTSVSGTSVRRVMYAVAMVWGVLLFVVSRKGRLTVMVWGVPQVECL